MGDNKKIDTSFSKDEHLCSKSRIGSILKLGRYFNYNSIKYLYLPNSGLEYNRLLISVPKRLFKRAVHRNLLKRRIREAYRLQKNKFEVKGVDIFLIYNNKEILDFKNIVDLIDRLIIDINLSEHARLEENN